MSTIVEFDGFGAVVRSNVILYREVVNDAVVRAWVIDWTGGDDPPIREHSIEGLREWMEASGGYDLSKLSGPLKPFDAHLWNYGLRQQFWVPLPEDLARCAEEGGVMATCLDATGREWLKEGESYPVANRVEDMVTIVVDGEERELFAERFRIG